MSSNTCLNRRLLSAILRAPAPLSSSLYRSSTPQCWVRTITSTSPKSQSAPTISFGAENDAILAQYMKTASPEKETKPKYGQSSKGREKKASPRSKTRVLSSPSKAPANAPVVVAPPDGYEISGFIDRSTQTAPEVEEARPRGVRPKKESVQELAAPEKPAWKLKTEMRLEKKKERQDRIAGLSTPPSQQPRPKLERWAEQKNALKDKFGEEGWNPRKKLSPDAMEGIRNLHQQDPVKYSTPVLADQFKVSAEAIRRILKSKWSSKTAPEKIEERRERWAKRHDRIWDQQAELGLRPQRKKEKATEDPDQFEQDMHRKELLGRYE